MGIRHLRAFRRLGVRVDAVCDLREEALAAARKESPEIRTFSRWEDFLSATAAAVDLVSVAANTPARGKILRDLLAAGAKRVLTEKPFTTNIRDAHEIARAYETGNVPLMVNTFRHFCPNHVRLRELLRSGRIGAPRHMTVQSPSTGLGNMGSVYFDLMNFYLESVPVEVTGSIDVTGTPSVRGPQYRDPGGWGMVRYASGARGFLDTSEDTGAPYLFLIGTTHGRVLIDEIQGIWSVSGRGEEDRARPLTYYLAPLAEVPFPLSHAYDPVEMTSYAMDAALEDRPEARNARAAVVVMEMIFGLHASDAAGRTPIRLPLDPRHQDLEIPFA